MRRTFQKVSLVVPGDSYIPLEALKLPLKPGCHEAIVALAPFIEI